MEEGLNKERCTMLSTRQRFPRKLKSLKIVMFITFVKLRLLKFNFLDAFSDHVSNPSRLKGPRT